MKLKTEHVYPPIPDRRMDWSCIDDDTYDGPESIIGYGRTEEEAIADFKEQWMDLYDEQSDEQSDEDYARQEEDADRKRNAAEYEG